MNAFLVEGGIEISWTDASDGENGFRIYRGDGAEPSGGEFREIGAVVADTTSYLDRDPEPGAAHRYAVSAYNGAGESARVRHDGDPVTAEPPASTVSVSIVGSGAGSVVSDPAGIDCGTVCTAAFAAGTTALLTATADPDSTFAGWQGACSGNAPGCTVAVDRTLTVGATFTARPPPAPGEARLAVGTSGDGTVASEPAGIACGATCVADFAVGTTVTLRAEPGPRATFGGWTGACAGASGATCELTLQADATAGAVFESASTGAEVRFGGDGEGLVLAENGAGLCRADCSLPFAESLTLRAAPRLGSVFGGWQGCDRTEGDRCTLTAPGWATASFATTGATALGPAGGDCDGTPSGDTCSVDVAISTAEAREVRALEFELASSSFTLTGAELGSALATGGGCLLASGPVKVAIACEAAVPLRDGATLATVLLRRDGALPTLVEVRGAFLVHAGGGARVEVPGGALGVGPDAPRGGSGATTVPPTTRQRRSR